MLFHVRRSDDSATQQSLKITLGGVVVGFIAMLILYWIVPVSIPAHKPVLTSANNYLPQNGIDVIKVTPFNKTTMFIENEPYGCNPMTINKQMQ